MRFLNIFNTFVALPTSRTILSRFLDILKELKLSSLIFIDLVFIFIAKVPRFLSIFSGH